ncbi:MAG: proline racemase family protein [Bacteroidota bacterium]
MSSVFSKIQSHTRFTPPVHWLHIRTIDMHTGGEPLRVILDGFPPLHGHTVLEYRRDLKARYDHLRKALMHEPRGHADMYGCLLLPPNDEGADFGILFLHNEGYSTMCGHAIIAISTLAVQMGWVEPVEPLTTLRIDAPCGRITAFVHVEQDIVQGVHFHSVPSFVLALDQQIEVPGLGLLRYDLAYGGAFYAYVDATQLGLELTPTNYNTILQQGMAIKRAIINSGVPIAHPFEADLSFLYGTIFIGSPVSEGVDSRNVCIFAEGEVDRCPTGSGVSGRMPLHYARQEIDLGQSMRIESITGSVFSGSIVKTLDYGLYEAVIPQVEGRAYITGQHEFFIDPDDPFAAGFFLR